jgi:hypothetical protein
MRTKKLFVMTLGLLIAVWADAPHNSSRRVLSDLRGHRSFHGVPLAPPIYFVNFLFLYWQILQRLR